MAQMKKTLENPLGLPPFQGCAVAAVGVTVSNAGGGLHEPLEIDKQMIESVANISIGDSVYFLIRADCNGVGYKPVKGDEDKVRYIPSFHATDTTIIDAEWAITAINSQRDRLARIRDEAEGRQPLFDENGNAINPLSLVGASDEEADAQ